MRTHLLVGSGALVLGFALGAALAPEDSAPRPEPVAASTDDARERELETEVRRLRREVEALRRNRRPVQATEPEEQTTPTAAGDDDEVQRRAQVIRDRAEHLAHNAEATARRAVEQERAAEKLRLEDLARGGAMTFLRSLDKDWSPPWKTLQDAEAFGALFARKTTGPTLDGAAVNGSTALEDGSEIVYGAGRFAFDTRLLTRAKPLPKDLLIRGAGIDTTVLSLSDMLRIDGEVHNLTFRDLTLDTRKGGDLERMRSAPFTLRLERCRVLGFDDGAGGSKMLGGSVGAFYASECEFVSGFGRSGGNLFRVGGMLLVRLERCTVSGPIDSIYLKHTKAAHVFDNCRFENVPEQLRRRIETPPASVKFVDCTAVYSNESNGRKKRPLSDLNPAWGK